VVRPALLSVSLCAVALTASSPALAAEDARVSFLKSQLHAAKDPRVRAQTVLLLGQTASEGAVEPLCQALRDGEPVVRTAAASALGDLRLQSAMDCLKAALGESDTAVRSALERAVQQGAVSSGSLYVSVEPIADKVGTLPEGLVQLAEATLRERLKALGAAFAPANEEKKAAQALIKARKLKGYQLKLQLLPGSTEKGLKVEMLVMTYPEQALQGSWNVKAAGGKPEALIKAMVPRVVDDAAGDLNWKN
jgi:hypothetical protein